MMFEHLTFEQISDFIDEALLEEEKAYILEHIRVCEICRCEYDSLCRCMTLVSGLREEAIQIPDLSQQTLILYRSRQRRRLYIKSIPAVAASIIIVTGAAFIKTGVYTDNRAYIATSLPAQNNTQAIINSIRDSDGRILMMTSSFIDGEMDKTSFDKLEEFLHRNNIKHSIIPVKYSESAVKNSNITDAGLKSGDDERPVKIYSKANGNRVTVRFFK